MSQVGVQRAPRNNFIAYCVAGFAAFGGYLYGYDTGYISGVKEMPGWLEYFADTTVNGEPALSSARNSLVTSIFSVGTFVGALLAYPIGDRLGRRYGIVASMGFFVIGVACQTAGKDIPTFVVGRVFAGLGVGISSALVPTFQAEVAPKEWRGALVACYQWMITIGLLIASCVVEGTKNYSGAACYQIPIGLQFIWAAILVIGIMILPESPRWLLLKGRDADALASLGRLMSVPTTDAAVVQEFDEIAANLAHERTVENGTFMDCFTNGEGRNRLRIGTGIALQALQQLTGINFIFYYGTQYFENSGIRNSFVITIITNVVNVVMTVPGLFAAERVGRRSMLLYGAIVMCIAHFIVAIVGTTTSTSNQSAQDALIAFVCIFIAAFACSWGILAWVVTSEIYPLAIRTKGMALSTASNWLWNFGIGYATPYLVDKQPGSAGLQSKVFFIWGGCCFIAIAFTYFFIPETRLLSLEQVDLLYRNSTIRGSNKYRKQLLANNISDAHGTTDKLGANSEYKEHVEDHQIA